MDFRPAGCCCKEKVLEIACPYCCGRGCRNGFRLVKSQVRLDETGRIERISGILRPRFRCCRCHRSWTVLEPGGFPHRTFSPTVQAAAMRELAEDAGATLSSLARAFRCDRRTVRRWLHQTLKVADPGDAAGHPLVAERGWDHLSLAWLLGFLDHLADLLMAHGFVLEPGPSVAFLFRWQFDHFRIVAYLTRASPPLPVAVGLAVG